MANIYNDEAPDFSSPKVMKRKYFGADTGPNFNPKKKKPVKVVKKEVSVETMPTGDIGSVDRMSPDVIGADMGATNIPAPVVDMSSEAGLMDKLRNLGASKTDRSSWVDPQEQARKSMGFKKGGSVSSASKRADGCAVRGKTKGRMV